MDKDLLLHIVEKMETDIRRIDEKVDRLLQFKWQVVAGGVVVSAFITILVQILSIVFK